MDFHVQFASVEHNVYSLTDLGFNAIDMLMHCKSLDRSMPKCLCEFTYLEFRLNGMVYLLFWKDQ